MQQMSGINKNLKTVVNLKIMDESIPATVLDSSFCRLVVFETFKRFSRGKKRSFGSADGIHITTKHFTSTFLHPKH